MRHTPKFRYPGLHINQRDCDLFQMLFDYKVATVSEISQFLFPNTGIRQVHRRLRKLESRGLLVSQGYKTLKGRFINRFHLSRVGFNHIYQKEVLKNSGIKLSSDSIEHDLKLLHIGERLKRSPLCAAYLTENRLQLLRSRVAHSHLSDFVDFKSDAYMGIESNNGNYNVAVEYERTQKKSLRYEHLIERYYLSPHVDIIFYFHETEKIKEIICELEERFWPKREPKFYFANPSMDSFFLNKVMLFDRVGSRISI